MCRPNEKRSRAFAGYIFSPFTLQEPGSKKGRITTGGALPYHISYGDFLSGLAVILLCCSKSRTLRSTLQPTTTQLPVIASRD